MTESKKFNRIATVILGVMVILVLIPLAMIILASFTEEKTLLKNGYSLFPDVFSADAYLYMVKQGGIIARAYGVSILVTVVGTLSSVVLTAMLAYPMSRKNFRFSKQLTFFVFFTMLFNGGIVSSYIMWTSIFHIKNTIWALIIPNYMVTAFNVFLVRNYYVNNIPDALIEAAKIDGANEFMIFGKIILPLSTPTIATISLFTGLSYWNDWVNGLYYVDKAKLYSIQMLLMKIMDNINALKTNSSSLIGTGAVSLPGTSIRMALAIIGILPILLIYPFVQKYFIRGVVVGAVKG